MYRKSILALVVAGSLVACGGSSGGSSNTAADKSEPSVPAPSAVEYKVIDGYLENADVCILQAGQSTCESIGVTNNDGVIEVSSSITSGQIIATISAGKTKDSDGVGFTGRSYQMVAEISADTPNVVTPFTTLDVLDSTRSMADIAAELNLTESVINGDYIASDDNNSAHAHTLARGLVTALNVNVEGNNIETLHSQALAVNEYIDTLINAAVDLSTVNIIINGDSIEHQRAVANLSDYLESGSDIYFGSINSAHFNEEGVRTITFTDGTMTIKNGFSTTYTIDDNKLMTMDGSTEVTDVFLYVSSKLSLSVPLEGEDLTIMSPTAFGGAIDYQVNRQWEAEDFIGKTFYVINDDSASGKKPTPFMAKMEFDSSTVTVTQEGRVDVSNWSMDAGKLKLHFIDAGLADRNITFLKSISDENITVVRDDLAGKPPMLLIQDESLANSILEGWQLIN